MKKLAFIVFFLAVFAGFVHANSTGPVVKSETRLVGNRYQVKQFIGVHTSPFSRDNREVAAGEVFSVKDLVVNKADTYDADYVLRLDVTGPAYMGARDLHRLIQSGAVVRMDGASGLQHDLTKRSESKTLAAIAPNKDYSEITGDADFSTMYHSVNDTVSRVLSDLLTGDLDQTDLPMFMVMVGTFLSLVWVLWHIVGFTNTLSFLTIVSLVYCLLSFPPGWLSLVPFSGLVVLLFGLLETRTFVWFSGIVAGCAAIGYVGYVIYYEINNPAVILVMSALFGATIGGLCLFLLLKLRKRHLVDKKSLQPE